MHYSYTSLAAPGGGVDHHNRCLGNRAWCVKVCSPLEKHVTVSNNIFKIISGYLRHCVRDYDMAANTVRGVCGLWAHLAAQLQQLQCLQYHQHGYIPSTRIPGICLPSAHNALWSGEFSVLSRCYTLSNLLFRIFSRAPCRVAMPPRRWSNRWAIARGKCSTSAPSAAALSQIVHITARCASAAYARWIITVPGWTTAWGRTIKSTLCSLRCVNRLYQGRAITHSALLFALCSSTLRPSQCTRSFWCSHSLRSVWRMTGAPARPTRRRRQFFCCSFSPSRALCSAYSPSLCWPRSWMQY